MALRTSRSREKLEVSIVSRGPSLHGAVFPVGSYPLPSGESAIYLALLRAWLEEIVAEPGLGLWLQTTSLQSAALADTLADRGTEWGPELGLGIRPGGEPPRMLRQSDFDSLRWDETPQLRHETVMFLEKGPAAARCALPLYLGTGAVLFCVLESTEQYLAQQRERWHSSIADRSFRDYPVYVPLLTASSLQMLSAEDLTSVLGNAVVYLRESPEDKSMIVLASRREWMSALVTRFAEYREIRED